MTSRRPLTGLIAQAIANEVNVMIATWTKRRRFKFEEVSKGSDFQLEVGLYGGAASHGSLVRPTKEHIPLWLHAVIAFDCSNASEQGACEIVSRFRRPREQIRSPNPGSALVEGFESATDPALEAI